MKTYLLPRIKATLFALLLPMMSTTLSAQTITKHYAIDQNNYITSDLSLPLPGGEVIPDNSEVINPFNAVGNNLNDYSILKIDYDNDFKQAKVNQVLIFRHVNVDNNTNRIVIGIGTNNGTPLSANTIKDLHLLTGAPSSYYGIFGNEIAYVFPPNSTLKLGGPDPTRGEIEIQCTSINPCDHIKINKGRSNTPVLDLLLPGYHPVNELRVYYAYQYKNSQSATNNILAYNKDGVFTFDKNILTENMEATLTNTSGKEVFRSRINANTFEAKLPEGMYILKLQTKENKIYTSKVIVK